MTEMPKIELDTSVDACYLRLSDGEVDSTEEFGCDGVILVDLDENREVVGIEILGTDTEIPLTELEHRYHIRADRAAQINMLLPSIKVRVQSTPDSVTTLAPNVDLRKVGF